MAGDRIDVYDESDHGRRIFNMSFEITMRFTMIRLSKSEESTGQNGPNVQNTGQNGQNSGNQEQKKRLLTVLSTSGRLFSGLVC